MVSLGDIPVWVFFGERCLWRCYPVFWVLCGWFVEAVLLMGEGMMGGFLVEWGGEGHCFSLWVSDIDPCVTGETFHCIFCAQVGYILGCHVPNLFPWVGGCHIPYGFHLLECCRCCYYLIDFCLGLFLGKGSGTLHCFVGLLVLCCFSHYGFLVLHNSFS